MKCQNFGMFEMNYKFLERQISLFCNVFNFKPLRVTNFGKLGLKLFFLKRCMFLVTAFLLSEIRTTFRGLLFNYLRGAGDPGVRKVKET